MKKLNDIKVGFCICGSFCTIEKALTQMKKLSSKYDILPIVSEIVLNTDTRFGKAQDILKKIEDICGKKVIKSVKEAEPIGPKNMTDIMVIAPATGNTIAKLSNGIIDNTVTMAAKSHLRNSRPLIIAPCTNDALGGAAKNIGKLLNFKNYYFVPFSQDDCINKPKSMVADFSKLEETIEFALKGEQIQPIIC